MTKASLDRRIKALESRAEIKASGPLLVCFVQHDQTEAEAIAAKWPDGIPNGRLLLICGWLPEDTDRR